MEEHDTEQQTFAAVVVGSGFGGAVTACRLAQAGIDVCVLERGRRYESNDFPTVPLGRRTNENEHPSPNDYDPPRDFARWLWPIDHGLWDVRDLGEVVSIQAAGYGGGSLVYASVHLRAPREVLDAWPEEYRGPALDPYYDLAAHMLGVTTFDQAKHGLAKTRRLREAAADRASFEVPLAVNFGNAGTNPWGKEQGTCDFRGFCCLGCGARAKNTLDLNYLALAENPNTEGGRPAEIRTLAEVTKIVRAGSDGPFEVTYRDHLLQEDRRIRAQHVFLCAGAVGTTELLLSNFAWVFPGAAPPRTPYFANADSLAVVFDCADAHEPDHGPTITAAALYASGNEWFLVQDGGVPEELEAALGVFRSPLFLYRNRYLELEPRTAQDTVTDNMPKALASRAARLLDVAATHFRRYRQTRSPNARALIAMLPPHSVEPVRGQRTIVWPSWLTRALRDRRELLFDQIAVVAEPAAQQTLDHLADLLEPRLREIEQLFPLAKRMLNDTADLGIARGLLSLGAQILWGSESDAVRNTLRYLVRTPASLDDVVQTLGPILRWCADYKLRDGRTGVLLTMGRDEPRMLQRVGDKVLSATSAGSSQRRLRQTQELALREIARRWGGELRTNPTWALGHRQLTVHGQGGAPMGGRGVGVTDPTGAVHGCPGLYVMDAAAFPSAVGVNPSATIAAVAERKVEEFVRKLRDDPSWRAPERSAAPRFNDPLRGIAERRAAAPSSPRAPTVEPFGVVGIAFKEFMYGHFAASDADPSQWVRERRRAIVGNEVDAGALRDWVRALEQAEIKGLRGAGKAPHPSDKQLRRAPPGTDMPTRGAFELKMDAHIADLTALLEDHPRCAPIALSGIIAVDHRRCLINSGTLSLFPPTGSKRRRLIEYDVEFDFAGAAHRLYALKLIEDDPRLDVWQDTATLYAAIEDASGNEIRRGVLRVPAKTFLNRQLKSLRVTGTTDDERRLWALAAFTSFFARNLAASYLPELERIPAILKNMLTRTHG